MRGRTDIEQWCQKMAKRQYEPGYEECLRNINQLAITIKQIVTTRVRTSTQIAIASVVSRELWSEEYLVDEDAY